MKSMNIVYLQRLMFLVLVILRDYCGRSRKCLPQGIAFNNDGTKMFIIGSSGDDVNEYNLSTAFDVSTASYTTEFFSASQDTNPKECHSIMMEQRCMLLVNVEMISTNTV